jgi:CRISPR-associated protein Cas2
MVLLILENVTPSVRGELTRWMIEIQAGVFIGNITTLVRETLWKIVLEKMKGGAGILVHSAANEQGFLFRYCGESSRRIEDFDGLLLARLPRAESKNKKEAME